MENMKDDKQKTIHTSEPGSVSGVFVQPRLCSYAPRNYPERTIYGLRGSGTSIGTTRIICTVWYNSEDDQEAAANFDLILNALKTVAQYPESLRDVFKIHATKRIMGEEVPLPCNDTDEDKVPREGGM